VYRDHVSWIYRLMYVKVGNQADSEDLTSRVFLAALPHLRTGASGGEVHGYLLATARTVLADHWRRRLGVPVTTLDDNVHVPAHHNTEPTGDHLERVRRLLGRLPLNYRRVLELRFLEGRSIRETAAELGITVANAKVVQHRALRRAAAGGWEDVRC
jgi:RNA polymerase sigma factor (sigma-70 family)